MKRYWKSIWKYKARASCDGCNRPYGDANGFPDLIIEDWAWKRIAPRESGAGLYCPCCILESLDDENIKCKGAFCSGNIESVTEKELRNIK